MRKKICYMLILFVLFLFPIITYAEKISEVSENQWYYQAVKRMIDNGTLDESDDLDIQSQITKVRYIDLLIKNLTSNNGNDTTEDLGENTYIQNINKAVEKGILEKDEITRKDMFTPVTRQKLVKWMILTDCQIDKNIVNNIELLITDYFQIADSYKEYIKLAYHNGLISGFSDGTFKPEKLVTYSEAIVFIDRLINKNMRLDNLKGNNLNSIGEIINTDIVLTINDHIVPSFNFKYNQYININDLKYYGFDIIINEDLGEISISYNKTKQFEPYENSFYNNQIGDSDKIKAKIGKYIAKYDEKNYLTIDINGEYYLPVDAIASEENGIVSRYDEKGRRFIVSLNNHETLVIDKYHRIQEKDFRYVQIMNIPYKFGYINNQGVNTVEPKYAWGFDYREGLACVQDKETQLWGYIDKSGKVVVDFKYEQVYSFSEGLACVKENGKWKVINYYGKTIIDNQTLESMLNHDEVKGHENLEVAYVTPFKEGYAYVVCRYKKTVPMRMTVEKGIKINRKGEIFNLKYKDEDIYNIGTFNYGLASFIPIYKGPGSESYVGYIDKSGKVVVEPNRYTGASFFSEGYAVVSYDWSNNYEIINNKGEVVFVIPDDVSYEVLNFHEGILYVSSDEKNDDYTIADYYDTEGNIIIKGCRVSNLTGYLFNKNGDEIYRSSFNFSEGLCIVKPDKNSRAFMDRNGEIVFKTEYTLDPFKNGLARVYKTDEKGNARYYYINKDFEFVAYYLYY